MKKIKVTLESFINEITLNHYNVVLHTSNSSDIIYEGVYLNEAENEFDMFGYSDLEDSYKDRSDLLLILDKKEMVYKFLLDEDIDDYPIEEHHDDANIYDLLGEEEIETIKEKKIDRINKKTEDLLSEVENHYKDLYGNYKYNDILVYDEEEYLGKITLRIADHSENIQNRDRFSNSDFHLSVVIAELDKTKERFDMGRKQNEIEIYFDSFNSKDEIIDEIEDSLNYFKSQF